MTIIANPIYDSVFKFLMEDKKVAKILLSALLKKEIIELEMKRQEYTSTLKNCISLFRLDFAAKIRNADGSENLVLIELQKTWLMTETLRFRQYLGTQYLDQENMLQETRAAYGLPIITVYILGHTVGNLTDPVIYVRRRYLDYDDNVIRQTDPFIESLTHDSVIVQIPFLTGRMQNRLERLLNVFNQKCQLAGDEHYLEIDDEQFCGEEQLVITRLLKAAATPAMRREMQIEDEILSEIEARDTTIMIKNQEIEKMDELIRKKNKEIQTKEQIIQNKEVEIQSKDEVIHHKEQEIQTKEQVIQHKEQEIQTKEEKLQQKNREIQEKEEKMLQTFVKVLSGKGMSVEEIAGELNLSVEQIGKWV